jgi:hypothetical protein
MAVRGFYMPVLFMEAVEVELQGQIMVMAEAVLVALVVALQVAVEVVVPHGIALKT